LADSESPLKRLLKSDVIGRPLRKLLWLQQRLLARAAQWAETLFLRHPYTQKGVTEFQLEHNESAFTQYVPAEQIERYYQSLAQREEEADWPHSFDICLFAAGLSDERLRQIISSICLQSSRNWLCHIYHAPRELETLTAFVGKIDSALAGQFVLIDIDSAAPFAPQGDYAAVLNGDALLYPNALFEMNRAIALNNSPDIIYSDESFAAEDVIYHKPAWSPLLFMASDYLHQLTLVKSSLITPLQLAPEDVDLYQLLLRLTADEAQVAAVPLTLACGDSMQRMQRSDEASRKAIEQSLSQRGLKVEVSVHEQTQKSRLHFEVEGEPLVSIVIPSKNGYKFIRPCLESIFDKTTYQRFEVIVIDHESDDADVLELFEQYKKEQGQRFSVMRYEGAFNFARMNNMGAKAAKGEYLLALNNDTEVITPDWLQELLGLAQQQDIGAVGGKLLYADGKIQHAGVYGRGLELAFHSGFNHHRQSRCYYDYLQSTHEALAVTAACLMISKQIFDELGGLDETYVPNGYGDVDLCLTLREKGYRNVYTPHCELYHKESQTRGANVEVFERYFMLNKWGEQLLLDPYFNPNLQRVEAYPVNHGYSGQQLSPAKLEAYLSEVGLE